MSATVLALLWCVIGALTHQLAIEEDAGPWWLTAAVVLSWPLLLLAHFTRVHVEIGMFEETDNEEI
ncbi:hypothetical protein RZS08_12385 [Arthrospira platensis SPKY1]|nr:hypothetical protein [Arthrospira platensis SPKY1]